MQPHKKLNSSCLPFIGRLLIVCMKALTCIPLYYDIVCAPGKPHDATVRYWYFTISFIADQWSIFCV